MTDTIENVTHDTAAKTQAMFGDMGGRAQDAMQKGAAMFADWNNFSRGNVEALVESGKIAMSGLSTLAQDRAAYARKQMEDTTAAVRTMASAKSPTEFVKLQGDFVRDQFDALVVETSRSTEATLKLAGEVAQPLSNRFAIAADKVRHAA